jgi:Holliday junction resolvasome RuvABC DNA-binding subunit
MSSTLEESTGTNQYIIIMNLKIEVKADVSTPSSWRVSVIVEEIELCDIDFLNKIPDLVRKQAEDIVLKYREKQRG